MVMSDELVIKDRDSKLSSRSETSIVNRLVRTDSIVSINNSFTSSVIESAEEVEGIERHEATSIKGVRQKLGNAFGCRFSLVLHFVDANASQ